MELINVIIIALLYVEIFHCVQAQFIFHPDPEEDIQLTLSRLIPPVNVTTVQCYSSSPQIKIQYVIPSGTETVSDINTGSNEYLGSAVNENACENGQHQYRVQLDKLWFIANHTFVGRTLRLKAILDNNEENSTLSRRTYTFPAPFNLTGSSASAILYSEFIWTCHVSSDTAVIEWYQGTTKLTQLGILFNGSCVTSDTNSFYKYTYDCQESNSTFTLTIPGQSLIKELEASTWRCRDATTEVKGSKFIEMDIVVPVINVTISPGSGSTFDANEHQTVTFSCITNNADPPLTTLWFISSSDVTSQVGYNRTTLTLNTTRTYNQKIVGCMAWNSWNKANLSDSTTLNVRFPPANNETLQITGHTSGQVLYENDTHMINLYCKQPGGNPVANMTFTCGSKTGVKENTVTEAIRRVNLIKDRNLNGKQCVCTSAHINGFMHNKHVSFTVYYPPSIPTISPSTSFPWKAPGTYNLTCNSIKGNPANTTFIWKERGSVLVSSAQFTFNPLNSSDNGRQLNCQVSNNFTIDQNISLTSNGVTLEVEYDPVVALNESAVEVVEGHEVALRCSATGNPIPKVTWYRASTSVTESTISSSVHSIANVSRIFTGNYTCVARSSSAGNNTLVPDKKYSYLRVFYPPTVSLHLQNTTENTAKNNIRCSAEGEPNNSTFLALHQMIGSILIRNITNFTELSPGNITLTIPRVSYQDMGTYTCLASNGIPDRSNQKIQSDAAYLNVITSAKFEMMQYTVRSDINTPAAVRVPFYRNPPASDSDVVWAKNTETSNETLVSSANVSLSLNNDDVKQTLHGVDVTLEGQSAVMNLSSFKHYHEGNYTLKIRSNHADSAEVTVTLIRSGPPDTPSNFQLLTRKVNSVVLTWSKGSNGGHQQTFAVLYREKTAEVYDAKQVVDTTVNVTITDEIKHLKSDASYEFILYSFNEKGNSTGYKILEERTLKEPSTSMQSSLNSGLVGGAAGGGAAVLVIIIVLVVVLKWKRNKREDNDSKGILNDKEMSAGPSKQSDEDEDGLKDNPLYGSSLGGANDVQGASAAPENPSLYAEVVKPKKKSPAKESQDPPPIYAEVDKSKKKGKGLMKLKKQSPPRVGEDPPPIYAEVHKSNKKNGKGKQQKQKTTTGDVYEVVDGFKEKETQFNDPAVAQKNKEGGQRGYRNQDGLLYVDVKFDQPPPTGKPIIRGEERTGYAMIEFEEPPTYSTADDVQGAEGGE